MLRTETETITYRRATLADVASDRYAALKAAVAEFAARRTELESESGAAITAGRYYTACTMQWNPARTGTLDGKRPQPRDGRGKFLPRTWLGRAECYLPSDTRWFRSPLTPG